MKFMNMKRFASTVLAGTMALSLAVPAMAVDETVYHRCLKETTLDVTVPAVYNATSTPMACPLPWRRDNVLSGQPITIATPLMIQNKSGVASGWRFRYNNGNWPGAGNHRWFCCWGKRKGSFTPSSKRLRQQELMEPALWILPLPTRMAALKE